MIALPRLDRRTLRYATGRLATSLLTVLGAMLLLFVLTAYVPGDAASIMLGSEASKEFSNHLATEMGSDLPFQVRFIRFLGDVLAGDLGVDPVNGRPVLASVAAVLPDTLILACGALLLALVAGVPLGVCSATRPGTLIDSLLTAASVTLISVPGFVIALLLLLVFSVSLAWFPVLGAGAAGDWADQARRLVLPVVSLSAGWAGLIARLTRASLLEVLNEPYIRTARAFGIPRRRLIYKYALKNAVGPLLAILGQGGGRLLGGAVLVETIFARPGLGRLILDAIKVRNLPVLQGAVLVTVVLCVGVNLIVDLAYPLVDPRMGRDR